ncbi:MAG: hypothetical protein GVY29_04125, partial [Spirochaetes bacterium]|nr:hypothetical protein [Spirochaetota bacterium]
MNNRHFMKAAATLTAVMILLLAGAPVFADSGGAGGIIVGNQISEYPLLENVRVQNNSLGLAYVGGFGYGVSSNGRISGGFGMGVFDPYNEDGGISGGFGGAIGGWRIIRRPIYLTLTSWTGIGGVAVRNPAVGQFANGYLAVFQEFSVELGIPFSNWFTPTLFAGYQFMVNLV